MKATGDYLIEGCYSYYPEVKAKGGYKCLACDDYYGTWWIHLGVNEDREYNSMKYAAVLDSKTGFISMCVRRDGCKYVSAKGCKKCAYGNDYFSTDVGAEISTAPGTYYQVCTHFGTISDKILLVLISLIIVKF